MTGRADGQGALADRVSKGVPRRGELRGVFVRTALAGRLGLPSVRQWSRGGAESRAYTYECSDGGRQTSITAGTALHRTKLPLTVWFWAAHLMSTHSNGMSAR